MKQSCKRFLAFIMAFLVLWAGNGYGVLEHSCEEHGKHQHLFSNWVPAQCDHHSETDEHSHESAHSGKAGFEAAHADEQINFYHLEAETLLKISIVSAVFPTPFPVASIPAFFFLTVVIRCETPANFSFFSPFRRRFGRLILTWVQSFLI